MQTEELLNKSNQFYKDLSNLKIMCEHIQDSIERCNRLDKMDDCAHYVELQMEKLVECEQQVKKTYNEFCEMSNFVPASQM